MKMRHKLPVGYAVRTFVMANGTHSVPYKDCHDPE
jgi:hypothetical protein